MDYEKKYKEALGWMKKVYPTMTGATKEDAEHHFPELVKNKDEKIRRWLIGYFKQYINDDMPTTFGNGLKVSDVLAWLGKQSEIVVLDEQIWQIANNSAKTWEQSFAIFQATQTAYNKGKEDAQKEQESNMIQWTGDNLKELVHFTGKSPKFEEWFKTWEDFENYVHTHNNIFKIFNEDGSHIEIPVGAWIVKTPDGYNVASRYVFKEKPADKDKPKFKVRYAGSEYNVFVVEDIAGETFYGIEDEPNHIDYVNAKNCKIIGGYSIKENGSPYPTKSAVFSEQNFIDKTEPKFHKGEWLQYRNAKPFFVEEITEQGYVNGISCLPFDWENEIHLWTIQDAKPGDVLVVDNIIFIYKRILSSHIVSYCKLINGKFEHFEDARTCCEGNAYVHPATKEQCGLLFQKMKEAGYEWDAEKKVLKKIEDKSLVIDEGKDEIDKSFTKMMLKGYNRQKPVWSEEDEYCINQLIVFCENCMVQDSSAKKCADWLKSLKGRVKSQLKRVWNRLS